MSGYVFPVAGDYRISSVFGNRRSPGGIGSTNHGGIDIAATTGTPVVSPVAGTVIFSGQRGGYGNFVSVRGTDGYVHNFAHLQGYNVQAGAPIQAGQQLGRVGSTGNSTGPHLHYEVVDNRGRKINPQGILGNALSHGKSLLRKGQDILSGKAGDAIEGAANVILPGSGAVLDGLGITSDCGWLCQLRKWISESGFFTRLALGVLALIIIAAAVAYFARGEIKETVMPLVKNTLKGKAT